jgi:UDP:flavonoid glycosyltransferase YjiC (YdhE family)
LILPHAHDQFDNASRVVRIGCGRALPRPKYNSETAFGELKTLLGNPDYFARAATIGRQVQNENGASTAADAIEEVLLTLKKSQPDYAASY